jgi:glycosyltransferase involved in cell wall biosynthesis
VKILHFLKGRCNPESANGVEKTIFHLAQHQAELGHEVHILGLTTKVVIPIRGVFIHHCSAKLGIFKLPPEVWKLIHMIAPDIVHFHSMYIYANILVARRLMNHGIPYVVTPHGGCSNQLLKRRAFLKIPYKIFIERPYLNKAAFIHSVGDTQAIKNYGANTRIVVAPNGINLASVPATPTTNPILMARPGWSSRSIFCFLGRLDILQKGLDLLVHGFHQALKINPNLGLVLVGPDWRGGQAKLRLLVERLKLSNDVYFAGPAYDQTKFDFILNSDFFVHTSRWEGLPFAVVEALACGTPCLVSRAANPCGLIGIYPAGIELDLQSSAIARSLLAAAELSVEQRLNMRQEALNLVTVELQWPATAKTITDAYNLP